MPTLTETFDGHFLFQSITPDNSIFTSTSYDDPDWALPVFLGGAIGEGAAVQLDDTSPAAFLTWQGDQITRTSFMVRFEHDDGSMENVGGLLRAVFLGVGVDAAGASFGVVVNAFTTGGVETIDLTILTTTEDGLGFVTVHEQGPVDLSGGIEVVVTYAGSTLTLACADVVATQTVVGANLNGLTWYPLSYDLNDIVLRSYFDNVSITYGTAVVVPPTSRHPTRRYPRDDNAGMGSAARSYPPPRAGRVFGAQH